MSEDVWTRPHRRGLTRPARGGGRGAGGACVGRGEERGRGRWLSLITSKTNAGCAFFALRFSLPHAHTPPDRASGRPPGALAHAGTWSGPMVAARGPRSRRTRRGGVHGAQGWREETDAHSRGSRRPRRPGEGSCGCSADLSEAPGLGGSARYDRGGSHSTGMPCLAARVAVLFCGARPPSSTGTGALPPARTLKFPAPRAPQLPPRPFAPLALAHHAHWTRHAPPTHTHTTHTGQHTHAPPSQNHASPRHPVDQRGSGGGRRGPHPAQPHHRPMEGGDQLAPHQGADLHRGRL
jgi:hypothetical protein